MKEELFTVNYLSAKDGYLYFSDYWSKRLCHLNYNTSALKVDYQNGKHAYFSWSPQPLNKGDNTVVCISATYAQKLGISNGEKVLISFYSHVPSVSRIHVSPVSQDDFEILALNQEHLQSGLLDQIHIVWPGQVFIAWVGTSMHAVVRVDAVEPKNEVGRLEMLTEVIVNPPPMKELKESTLKFSCETDSGETTSSAKSTIIRHHEVEIQKTTSVVTLIWDSIQGISSKLLGTEEKCDKTSSTTTLVTEKWSNKFSEPMVYRVHPIESLDDSKISSLLLQPFSMFIRKKNLPPTFTDTLTGLVAKLEGVILLQKSTPSLSDEDKKSSKKDENQKPNPCVYVKICVIEDIVENLPPKMKSEVDEIFQDGGQKCVFLSKVVRAVLQVKLGGRVRVEIHMSPLKHLPLEVQLTPAVPVGVNSSCLEAVWKNYMQKLCKDGEMLITSNIVIPLCSSSYTVYHTKVTLLNPSLPYGFFSSTSLENCKVKISLSNGNFVAIPTIYDNVVHYKEDYHSFSHLEKEIEKGKSNLEMTLGLTRIPWSLQKSVVSVVNILITGKHGSGISTFAKHLCGIFNSSPWYAYCVEIQCRSLKGKKVEVLQRLLADSLAECNLHQPAILLLHDLDVLVASPNQVQEVSSVENFYFMRVGKILVDLLEDYQPYHKIAVIATAESSSKFTSTLMAARGQHTFLALLEIPDLTKEDRAKILEILIKKKVCLGCDEKLMCDLKTYAQKSDGFVVQDLVDLVEKAVFEAWKRTGGLPEPLPNLEIEDLEKAFNLTQPLGLRGVNLVQNSSLSWDDIGGLDIAKKLLIEMLEWPVEYPELFAQAPLRLQSGLLLYGAPGTGKTLLAGAVAKECGLNFISVKGPELLSKYIGASEEAVRTVFQKAQSAKPCVLFFDEFDSLAPRRGHDSTGVTDRVVNQLLTQLDGVETLNGVWVLAASSRPDLLDPALLRPGRLDRAVLCPLPSEVERKDILKSLSRKMNFSDDVDLDSVVKSTPGFTGADLQAVLYTSQLLAMEDLGDGDKANSDDLSENLNLSHPSDDTLCRPILVTSAHLQMSLKDTRPSLSAQERLKYEQIYTQFEKSRSSSSLDVVNPNMLKQKVTLA